MNKVIVSGAVGKDPQIKESQNGMKIARYSLAVRRVSKKDGEQDCDWISLIAFDKRADFVEKYVKKGTKLIVEGHISTGKYTDKDGRTNYTTDIIVDNQEFCESKSESTSAKSENKDDDFANVDGDIDDLPFN